MHRTAVTIGALSMSVAYAQGTGVPPPADPEYPIEVVDRPLVMHAGMNELALFYSRGHGLVTTMDAMGNPVTMRSEFGDRVQWTLGYAHSFGRVELLGLLSNEGATLGARVAPMESLVVGLRVTGEGGTYAAGGSYYRIGQSLRAGYRMVHVPRRFALHVNGGVFVQEFKVRVLDGTFRKGVETSADVGAYGTVQIAQNLSAWLGATVGALVHSTIDTELDGGVSPEGGLQFSLRRLDFSMFAGVTDVTDTRRLVAGAQIGLRWGL